MPAGKIRRHPGTDMPQAHAILRSIPGVGPVTAAALMCWVPEPGTIGNRQAAALAGVAPHPCDSGDRTGRRSVRAGRRRPRRVLYMAAMAAAKYNAPLAAFHRRLVERGKPHKVAIVAVMRKLVVLANTPRRERRGREDRGPATAWGPGPGNPRAGKTGSAFREARRAGFRPEGPPVDNS